MGAARRRLEEMRRRLPAALVAAEAANLEEALNLARALSTGTLTARDLKQMDHPYARRHGGRSGIARPDIINRRTGRFLAGWQTKGPALQGGQVVSLLYNHTPEATFLAAGTKTMVPRPVDVTVMRLLEPNRRRRLRDAIRGLVAAAKVP